MASRRFTRNRLARAGLAALLAVVLIAAAAPALWGDAHQRIPLGRLQAMAYQPPSLAHPFGTDELGRDVLARAAYGARISLLVGLAAAAIAAGVGTLVGAVSGYSGGTTDHLLQRLTEGVATLPFFFLVLAVVAVFGNSLANVILVVGLSGWTGTARLVRGQVLQAKAAEYVQAARALGAGDLRLVVRHILPGTMGVVAVNATLTVANVILLEAALSYFGLGVPSTVPTWGNMLSSAQQYLHRSPWLAVFPGVLLLITALSINLVGDGLRDALDPGA